jgi:NAD(P)-dependent dehydrogenase (short-subunit alcohol dehydrogenase family)
MGLYIVSGASSGIGAAVCQRLIDDGETVIGLDRISAQINADLATPSGRENAVAQCRALAKSGLDGLVCCAGVGSTFSDVSAIPQVNYFGSIDLVTGLGDLLTMKSGAVVLVSSNSASQSTEMDYVNALLAADRNGIAESLLKITGHGAYSGAKQAISKWMRRNAPDYARRGIRLNAVAPGYTRTAMTADAENHLEYGKAIAEFLSTIPLGRAGETRDIAQAIGFLLSNEASFVSGSILYVDGGHDAMFRPDSY